MIRLIWIPLVFFATLFNAFMTYKYSSGSLSFIFVLLSGSLLGIIFPIFSRWSTNLFIDVILVNIIIFFSFGISVFILTKQWEQYNIINIFGILFLSIGFILINVKG